MNTQEIEFPKRIWTYQLGLISSGIFMLATASLLTVALVPQFNTREAVAVIAGIFGLSFILRLGSQLLSKYGYQRFKARLRHWANSRYGIILEDEQLTQMLTPRPHHDSNSNYWSKSFGYWFENDQGRRQRTRLSLMVVDDIPLLFEEDKSVERVTLEEKAKQEIINDFVQEASENEKIYLYTERAVSDPLAGSRVLIWSDELRATLFMNGRVGNQASPVFVIPIEVFMEEWVPTALAKNVRVGINWADNDYVFNLRKLFISS